MAFFIVFLLLIAAIALGPWLGTDSRGLDLDHQEAVHPLQGPAGVNC